MAINTLVDLSDYFLEKGVYWWVMYGTLLDVVRGSANDKDIDVGILAEDKQKINNFGNGFAYPDYWNYGKDPIINVQAWTKVGNKRYYCQNDFLQQELPEDMGVIYKKYKGIEVPIPYFYEFLFNDWFSDWRTPMKEKARTRIYKIKKNKIKQIKFENKWQV